MRYSLFYLLAVLGLGLAIVDPHRGDGTAWTQYSAAARQVAPSELATSKRGKPVQHLTIEAVGQEFGWHFRLPGPDRCCGTSDDVQLGDRLRLPVDCEVEILLRSVDYVYVFSVPELELREIAVPEMTFRLQFHTRSPGTHEVLADPMCGVRLFHDERMGQVSIELQSEFRQSLDFVEGHRE